MSEAFWKAHSIKGHSDTPSNKGERSHAKSSLPTAEKAKQILKDDSAQGHPLTPKQKGFFGMIAGGKTPTRAKH